MADSTVDSSSNASNLAEMRALQQESQAFQLGMAQLQSEDAKAKSKISVQEGLAASDRDNAKSVGQYLAK